MSSFQTLKATIPQYPQYQMPSRNQQNPFTVSDRYGVSYSQTTAIANQLKSKGGLPCKKDKKHQSFDLIFICLEKECTNSLKPICAQCLHEEHSGHEIKLIKEIAEIANNFISQERRKKKISPYWEQLSEQYTQLYNQIDSIINHLQTFQSTLKKSNEEFFSKLNSDKNEFWETVESASQKILSEKYSSEDDLFQKIRLILKNVKIDDPSNPTYRYNILKEETVLLVIQNYKEIDALVCQTKDYVMQTLNEHHIKESYQASEFKITDGEDYMKITSIENKNGGSAQQCIVEFDDKEDENKSDENDENFDDEEDDYDNHDLDNNYSNKINKNYLSSGDKKEKKYQQENLLNDSDEFDLIEDVMQKQSKQEYGEGSTSIRQGKEIKQSTNSLAKVPQLPKISSSRPQEKPSTQDIRMKYAADFSTTFWNQQSQQPQSQTVSSSIQPNLLRKKELPHFDDLTTNNDYQYTTDFFSRYTTNAEDLFKHNDTTLQQNPIGNSHTQYSGIPRSSRPLPPPNNLSVQTFINSYQKM